MNGLLSDVPTSLRPPRLASVARVRGHAFLGAYASLEGLRGQSAQRSALPRLVPSLRVMFEQHRLVEDEWYPIAWYKELLSAVRVAGGDSENIVRAIGAECSRRDLSGPYRWFARLLRPQALFAGSMRFFRSYYDTGEVWVQGAGKGSAQAIWKGCQGFDRNMWVEVIGSCEAILEIGGARELSTRIMAGGNDGDAHMELRARWC